MRGANRAISVVDLLCGALVLSLAGWYFNDSLALTRSSVDPLGGAFYPRLLAGGSAICGLLLIARSVLRSSRGRDDEESGEEPASGLAAGVFRFLLVVVLGVAFVLGMPLVGYPVAIFLLTGLLLLGLGVRSPVGVLATCFGTALVLHTIFVRLLHVPLPAGIWGV